MNRYFCDFHTSEFYFQTPKAPVLLDFLHTRQFTLDINTTHSTWLERTE